MKRPTSVVTQPTVYVERGAAVSLTGEVMAQVTNDLSFRVGGRMIVRNVDVGAHVTADQILATVEPQEQQATVDAAQASVGAAEAQLRLASSTLERQKALIARGFTTRREYDQSEESFRSAQGALDVANAQLATAKDQLSYTTLRAGAAGIITVRNAEAGQVVQAAQAIYTLAQDGPRDAVFNVYESIFTRGASGASIALALVSDPRVTAVGRIREVSPTVDPATGTVRVKFEIGSAPPAMGLGAVLVGSGTFKPTRVAPLPWSALASDNGKPAMWVVDPASKAVTLKRVSLDGYENRTIFVRDGLLPGDLVVTQGQQLLHPQQTVILAGGGGQ